MPENQETLVGAVAEIRTAVMDGNSYYFIRLEGSEFFYSVAAKSNPSVVILNLGEEVTIIAEPQTDGSSILNAYTLYLGMEQEPLNQEAPAPVADTDPETPEEAPAE